MARKYCKIPIAQACAALIIILGCLCLMTGCQEAETIKREVLQAIQKKLGRKAKPFKPRDGITIRDCRLYSTANPNSQITRELMPETRLRLVDKVGDFYRTVVHDGTEGYVNRRCIGGQETIDRIHELRESIEGVPVQAVGVLKNKANFRLYAGRKHDVLETLAPDREFEMFERVVTLREIKKPNPTPNDPLPEVAVPRPQVPEPDEQPSVKKDVWYKIRLTDPKDRRVGFVYTHNLKFTPPAEIERMVPYMRMVAWRVVSTTEDPDLGPKNNYAVAYAPIGRDPECDYTTLYYMYWHKRLKRLVLSRPLRIPGILPITGFHHGRIPGFTIRRLIPSQPGKLLLIGCIYDHRRGKIAFKSEDVIPDPHTYH